jgi:hypothetical protein
MSHPTIHIAVDTREKKPLLFPEWIEELDRSKPPASRSTLSLRVMSSRVQMAEGDYRLIQHVGVERPPVLIERKGSVFELAKNLLSVDRERAEGAIDRLCALTPHPILLLEGHPTVLMTKLVDLGTKKVMGSVVMSALIDLTVKHPHLTLLWLPTDTPAQRRALGEWVARLLYAWSLNERRE